MATLTQQDTRTAWNLDAAHSLVEFSARHMMLTTVKGRFADVQGTVEVDAADPSTSSVRIDIAAASIDTRSEQRDQHLRSADFFDVEQFPAITFRSTRVEGVAREAGDRLQVTGDLTIRDVTREFTLEVTFEGLGIDPWGGERASYSAEARLDRRDFGLTWNQALETGGVLVSNEIKLSFEIQAVKAA